MKKELNFIFKNVNDFLEKTSGQSVQNGCTQDFLESYYNNDYSLWMEDNKTNRYCFNCRKCEKCEYCNECDYCTKCVNCDTCETCENCKFCHTCEGCKKCEACVETIYNENCKYCNECEYCDDCIKCIECNECIDCTLCKNCVECNKCEWMTYCSKCNNCAECEECVECENIRNLKNAEGYDQDLDMGYLELYSEVDDEELIEPEYDDEDRLVYNDEYDVLDNNRPHYYDSYVKSEIENYISSTGKKYFKNYKWKDTVF